MSAGLKAAFVTLLLAYLAACARINDGGIVGSGNRVDCERTPTAEGCARTQR